MITYPYYLTYLKPVRKHGQWFIYLNRLDDNACVVSVFNKNLFNCYSGRCVGARAAMAATKYSHPFMQGLKPPPEGYEEGIQQIREWCVRILLSPQRYCLF